MILNRENSILLVIDLQEKLVPEIRNVDYVLANSERLVRAAKILDVPRLVTEQYPRGIGQTVSRIGGLIEPTEVVEKITFSAMGEDSFRDRMKGRGRTDFVLIGVEAHVCVLQTALGLLMAIQDSDQPGFDPASQVYMVSDAVGSRRDASLEAALSRFSASGGRVVTSEMVMFEWLERAGTDQFRQVLPLIK